MKRLKLEVVKLDNEDVIATSEFCKNHNIHIYFTDFQLSNVIEPPDKMKGTEYWIEEGKWYSYTASNFSPVSVDHVNFIELEGYDTGKYYVLNATSDGFVECTKHHNPSDATPVSD